MSPIRNPRRSFLRGRWCAVVLVVLITTWSDAPQAYTVTNLYSAAVPVSERAPDANAAAFREAMAIVLVKVTGLDEAPVRLRSAVGNARAYVQRYGYDANGQLEVGFDRVAIDRLITAEGLPIWGMERPVTLLVARLRPLDGPAVWLSADSADLAREAIDDASDQRGVPLIWPLVDAADRRRLSAFDQRSPRPEDLGELAGRYRADAILYADLRETPDGSLEGLWTLGFDDETGSRSGGPADGIALAAERFVTAYAATANDVVTIDVDVVGITDLAAYARTLDYLEKLSLTEQVAVEEVAGDSVRLRLTLRGDPSTFQRSLALDDRLLPLETPSQPGRLSYRYQP
jgi:hypothetical protein